MTIGHPGALWIPSPFHSRGYPGFGKPKWVIIHGTASGTGYSAQQTGRDFQRQGNSTHYVVGYDGTIVQCVDEANAAWGNGIITGPAGTAPKGGGNPRGPHDAYWNSAGKSDPNSCTISIEHSRSKDNQSPLSAVQQQKSFELVRGICQRWGIPAHYGDASGGITGHYSIDPLFRAFCPGPYPWDQLMNYIGGTATSPFVTPPPVGTPGPGAAGLPAITDISVPGPSTYVPMLEQVHETLINHPGFYGIALSLDEAEQFPGYIDLTQPVKVDTAVGTFDLPDVTGTARSVGATVTDNFLPFAIRSGLVLLGMALVFALVVKPVMQVAGPVAEVLA